MIAQPLVAIDLASGYIRSVSSKTDLCEAARDIGTQVDPHATAARKYKQSDVAALTYSGYEMYRVAAGFEVHVGRNAMSSRPS